jgi:hypothetical protein
MLETGYPAFDKLGWCLCGDPAVVEVAILNYLRAKKADPWLPADTAEEFVWAYICDDAKWTEHGTSIEGAWLTPSGQDMIDDLEKAYSDLDF